MDIDNMEVGDTVTISDGLRHVYPIFAAPMTVTKVDKSGRVWWDHHGLCHNINYCWRIVDKAVAPW